MLMLWKNEFLSEHDTWAATTIAQAASLTSVQGARNKRALLPDIPRTARLCCSGNITVLKGLRSDSSALVGFVAASPLRDWVIVISDCVNKGT